MSDANKAIFLSYAREDSASVRKIADALRAAGVEVWFDETELRGGDSWDANIRKQIKECALFVPVISAQTQVPAEDYFRLEWKLAVDPLISWPTTRHSSCRRSSIKSPRMWPRSSAPRAE